MRNCGFNFQTSYKNLPGQLYTEASPDIAPTPEIVTINHALAQSLGLDFSELDNTEQAALFSGNQLPEGASSLCQAYAGHQFGRFTILGDGRAHLCGEHVTPSGDRFDVQFKGSGKTPYTRNADGKAALAPMLREYIISEAMHYLGIPTTRSLAVITTGEPVIRERILPGAILTRIASSHIRVGTFEFAANCEDHRATEALLNYTIERHYPELINSKNKALDLINTVMDKQADLIVNWMRVGFIHGVMNTDNMTISGETIDYGPCAFMDAYNPDTHFSSIDHMGRYAFANQPKIAQWNLARFAETLLPYLDTNMKKAIRIAEKTINQFSQLYHEKWLSMMRSKLGLFGSETGDEELISDFLRWMHINHADYTNTFREVCDIENLTGKVYEQASFKKWYHRWRARLEKNMKPLGESINLMKQINPTIIPRNHKVEQALDAANQGDYQPFTELLTALKTPYSAQQSLRSYQTPPKPHERIYQTFCGT